MMNSVRRPITTTKTPQTGFPVLTNVEIVNILAALDLHVQMDDVAKPTTQSAQMIFTALLDQLMGANVDMIEGPKGTLMSMMEYKELYSEALQFTMFYRHCREMATVCGIHNFGISDLTRPDPMRFRHHLSGVLNFAKYMEDKEQKFAEPAQRLRDQFEQTERMKDQLIRVENTIEEISIRNVQDRPLTEEAKKRNEAVRAELLNLRSEQVQLSHTVESLKSERQQVMELAASKNNEQTVLSQNTALARSRLVQSPDRIKRHISEMSSTVSAEKASLASIQRKTHDLSSRLEIIGTLESDLKGLIEMERKVEQQKSKVEEMKRNLMKLRGGCEGKQIEADGLKARLDQLDRQWTNAKDKFSRQQVALSEMRERSKTRMEGLGTTYEQQKKERAVWEKTIQRLKADQKALDLEMQAFTQTHETEINDLLAHYWEMRRQAEAYMKTVNGNLNLEVAGL
ncbi:Nuf2 family-domain-containing protein [Kockovaella imperatae]|uniref:Nuf2 family-domain-containing protein n=1 Tax=Kockovaella imperatae TaxID=4999 RepID=A0A1Y1UUA9_9TREE|nr:Nuf2 family-domain-containing protein [Kockovaella imperatae]ORX41026.1 Nuf2 family-domain-containing protein [Kockovaella imperatae]